MGLMVVSGEKVMGQDTSELMYFFCIDIGYITSLLIWQRGQKRRHLLHGDPPIGSAEVMTCDAKSQLSSVD
jgi:hypothetical protein